jgi:polyprenyl P-hydroxybenzoate/phenylacrylic acid decarboxylase-like protein
VILKERRRLVLIVREAPLNLAHLRNMVQVTEMGGVVFPPVPAFYSHAKTVDDLVNHTVGRVLDLFGVEHEPHQALAGHERAAASRIAADRGHRATET